MTEPYYQMKVSEVIEKLNTNKDGLSNGEVNEKRRKYGSNIVPKKKIGFFKKYIKPVFNLMLIILFICAFIQLALGENLSAYIILTILLLNVFIAMGQQFKVEKTLKTLEKLTAFKVTVLRDNETVELDADQLVPGDIIVLNQGDYISADARVIEANDLSMDESVLTGEPVAVDKYTEKIDESPLPIQKQNNMIFSSTFVTSGTGKAVVVSTGLDTEIGKITKGVAQKEYREIPLQENMNKLAKGLGFLVLAVIAGLFLYSYIKNPTNVIGQVSWLVSLAVAAIPFNFPIITTIILLTGVLYLARKQAIVRNINSIETMGRLSVICSDKTGTLTKNQMTVRKILYDNKVYHISGEGYSAQGNLTLDGNLVDIDKKPLFGGMFLCGIINNNARIVEEEVALRKGTKNIRKVIGMPTEGALLVAAEKVGFAPKIERKKIEVLREFSFSSERKRMSKIIKKDNERLLFTKGAPERVVDLCHLFVKDNKVVPFSEDEKALIKEKIDSFAENGLRNLAFAFRQMNNSLTKEQAQSLDSQEAETDLVFLGVMAMIDPPRAGVKESIKVCEDAGIHVSMITGDHPITAKAIAKNLNIYKEGDMLAKGAEIKNLSPEEIEKTSVFARVAPEDKFVIVKALQNRNNVVAMTGDGVNDVLALENADVGIAMGIAGTDVAKNSADLILTDDSFTTIETALYHGRGLFNNIRANIVFLLVCNLLELILLTVIKLSYNQELFLEFQLLILYSTIHFFPPFGLMFDKYHEDLMKKKPKKPDEPILDKDYKKMMVIQIFTIFLVMLVLWFIIYYGVFDLNTANLEEVSNIRGDPGYFQAPIPPGTDTSTLPDPNYITTEFIMNLDPTIMRAYKARTIIFMSVIFSEMWVAFEGRSINLSMFKLKKNTTLYVLVGIVLLIAVGIQFFDIALCYLVLIPLAPIDWVVAIGASLIVLIVTEVFKKRNKKK